MQVKDLKKMLEEAPDDYEIRFSDGISQFDIEDNKFINNECSLVLIAIDEF